MEQPLPRLVLVRHGETEWSLARRHTSHTDLPLTGEGRAAAERLKPLLADWRFARVLTSPLQRAKTTCEIAGFGHVAEVRGDLREWDYGLYEGRLTADIRAETPTWQLWRNGAPRGETAEMVGSRADHIIAEVRSLNGDSLVFGHAHMLRVLAARWLELPPRDGRLFMMDTGAVSVLGYEREQPTIVRWNQVR